MPIDAAKIDEGIELVRRGRAVLKKIEVCKGLGFLDVDQNEDLRVPFSGTLETLYTGRADALIQSGQILIRDGRTA